MRNKKYLEMTGEMEKQCLEPWVGENLDANIKDDIPNNVKEFLQIHPTISTIVLNGGLAKKEFHRYFPASDFSEKIKVISLISSSNAASKKFEEKLEEWKIVKDIIDAQTEVYKD